MRLTISNRELGRTVRVNIPHGRGYLTERQVERARRALSVPGYTGGGVLGEEGPQGYGRYSYSFKKMADGTVDVAVWVVGPTGQSKSRRVRR